MLLLSLLTIIYGIKGEEGGGSANLNLLPESLEEQISNGNRMHKVRKQLETLTIHLFLRIQFHKVAAFNPNTLQEYRSWSCSRLWEARVRGIS